MACKDHAGITPARHYDLAAAMNVCWKGGAALCRETQPNKCGVRVIVCPAVTGTPENGVF
jgi:hypothetical protein